MSSADRMRLNDPKYCQLYIKGNGNVADMSGHKLATAWVGTPAYTTGPYSGHDVLSLDGSTPCVTAPQVITGTGPMTAAVWVRSSGTQSTYADIMSQGHNQVPTNTYGWAFQFNFPTVNNVDLIWGTGVGVAYKGLSFAYTPNTDFSWHHLVFTKGAGETTPGVAIYKDGILIATDTTNNFALGTFTFTLGADTANPDREWKGQVANARIYNVALTGNEVFELFQSHS